MDVAVELPLPVEFVVVQFLFESLIVALTIFLASKLMRWVEESVKLPTGCCGFWKHQGRLLFSIHGNEVPGEPIFEFIGPVSFPVTQSRMQLLVPEHSLTKLNVTVALETLFIL